MIEENQFCNQCKRHCSANDLQCGKGKRFFENKIKQKGNSDNMDKLNDDMNNKNDDMNELNDKHNKGEQGEHKRHRNCECSENTNSQEDDLLSLMSKCGHFMLHKNRGHRGQGKILKILAENNEISQKEMQDRLGIQSGSISEIVKKLEHKGFLTRIKDETDKRMTKLLITDLGLEKIKEIDNLEEVDDKELLQPLSEEEQETLRMLLLKLTSSWEETYGMKRVSGCNHGHRKNHMNRGGRGHGKHHMHHGNRHHHDNDD